MADYGCSIQLIIDENFHKLAVASYRLTRNYAEMILSLNVLNILYHRPEVVESCVLFARELEVSYQIVPL